MPWICTQCALVREKPEKRLPTGWKRKGDAEDAPIYCGECWRKNYLLRAITIRVAKPLDISWEQLREGLKIMWRQSTALANWATTELYAHDYRRMPTDEKLPELQRWSEDAKFEQRPVPAFAVRREDAARKYRNRMQTATHEIAAQLVGYAERRKFAAIRYDDSDRSYLPDFTWFRLAAMIAEKADAAGIEFTLASGEAVPERAEALATQ